jgi:predicted transcriptional regulator
VAKIAYRCDDSTVAEKDRLARLAAAIKRRRAEVSISQEGLAFATGISLRHLQRIEGGTIDLRVSTLYQIATALETTPAKLLGAGEDQGRRQK